MTTDDDFDFCMFDLPTRTPEAAKAAADKRRVQADAAAVAYTMAAARGEDARRAAAEAAARAGGAR